MAIQLVNPTFNGQSRSRWANAVDSWPNLLLTTLIRQRPFVQTDWPSPQGVRYVGSVHLPANVLVRGIPTPAAPVHSRVFDSSFTTVINRPIEPPNLLITTLKSVAIVVQGSVTFANASAYVRKVIPVTDPPNLLITTLALSNPKPFAQFDWPQVYRPRWISSDTIDNPVLPPAAVTTPFAQLDWPAPQRARSLNPILIGRFVIPPGVIPVQTPFSLADWPLAVGPKPVLTIDYPPNLTLQMVQPVILPAMVDSRGPNIARWSPKVDDLPNATLTTLSLPNPQPTPILPQSQVFSRWINPVDPVTNQLPLGFVLPPAPFSQQDWPPPFATRVLTVDVPYNLSTATFINVTPFNQSDWPPPFPQGFVRDIPPPNLLCTLQFVAPVVPFVQSDWPNAFARPLIGKTDEWPNIILSVNQPNPKPFNLNDWPQPFRASWAIWIDELSNSPLVTISPTPAPPIPPIPGSGLGREGGSVVLQPKKQGETLTLQFNFISILAQNEILVSAQVICRVYSGNDPNPQAMIPSSATVAGTQILQTITGGVVGTVYELLCIAATSLSRVPEISSYYVVEPDLA